MVLKELRPFHRWNDGLQIWLRFDEWPVDVPLPEGTRIAGTGEGNKQLLRPYWRFVLEPERTIEVVVGLFVLPLELEETIGWFRRELAALGWEEVREKGYRLSRSAAVYFRHPVTGVWVVVSVYPWQGGPATRATIRRVVEHPWEPVEVEELEALEQLQGEGEEEKWEEEEVVVGS